MKIINFHFVITRHKPFSTEYSILYIYKSIPETNSFVCKYKVLWKVNAIISNADPISIDIEHSIAFSVRVLMVSLYIFPLVRKIKTLQKIYQSTKIRAIIFQRLEFNLYVKKFFSSSSYSSPSFCSCAGRNADISLGLSWFNQNDAIYKMPFTGKLKIMIILI